jgi:hypothetical protein
MEPRSTLFVTRVSSGVIYAGVAVRLLRKAAQRVSFGDGDVGYRNGTGLAVDLWPGRQATMRTHEMLRFHMLWLGHDRRIRIAPGEIETRRRTDREKHLIDSPRSMAIHDSNRFTLRTRQSTPLCSRRLARPSPSQSSPSSDSSIRDRYDLQPGQSECRTVLVLTHLSFPHEPLCFLRKESRPLIPFMGGTNQGYLVTSILNELKNRSTSTL